MSDTTDQKSSKLAWNPGILFPALTFVGIVNAEYLKVITSIENLGFFNSIYSTFEISLVHWFGVYLCLSFLRSSEFREFVFFDMIVMSGIIALFILPISGLSWIGLSVLGVYFGFFCSCDNVTRRGLVVLLALCYTSFWSRYIFNYFLDYILFFDAFLVATFAGVSFNGNLVESVDGKTILQVLEGCSSFSNISLSVLGWVMARSYYGTRGKLKGIIYIAGMIVVVLLINTVRIAVIAWQPDLYDVAHGPIGANIASLLTTAAIAAISMHGAAR